MAFHLPPKSIHAAIAHLQRFGDTDVLPHLPELRFLADDADKVVSALAAFDLHSYVPIGAMEVLAPKGRLGFRIVHQLSATDTVLLLAAVVELGPKIEAWRTPKAEITSFSYRFELGGKGEVFASGHNYKAWLSAQYDKIVADPSIHSIVQTDISDFYARVNFHRLENVLNECCPHHGAALFVKKHISIIRAKQSFGIPVGGSAARLLAELALCDTDQALQDAAISSTRYVDDFRLFLTGQQNAYDALGCLAEHLGINEGLSLNVAKTAVFGRKDFLEKLERQLSDVAEQAEADALENLDWNVYFDDEPDEEWVKKVSNLNLLGYLDEELSKDAPDVGRIKLIFRALRVAAPTEAIDYIKKNFDTLIPFARELVLLMQILETGEICCFDDLLDDVVNAITSSPASSVQSLKSWLLELFVRGVIAPTPLHLHKLSSAFSSPMHRRQELLIRGRMKQLNYFRKQKTAFEQFSAFEKPCLIIGASCLPKDEYEVWVKSLKQKALGPTDKLFCDWAIAQKDSLLPSLHGVVDEHPD